MPCRSSSPQRGVLRAYQGHATLKEAWYALVVQQELAPLFKCLLSTRLIAHLPLPPLRSLVALYPGRHKLYLMLMIKESRLPYLAMVRASVRVTPRRIFLDVQPRSDLRHTDLHVHNPPAIPLVQPVSTQQSSNGLKTITTLITRSIT